MTNKQQGRGTEYDRGYDEGYEEAQRRTRRSNRRGIIGTVLGVVVTLAVVIGLLFAVFLGGIWLGSLVTGSPTDAPVTPVVPAHAGANGDVTIVEGDTTVTVAGTGAATIPTPMGDITVIVEPTTIVLPTNGDLTELGVHIGGVTVTH